MEMLKQKINALKGCYNPSAQHTTQVVFVVCPRVATLLVAMAIALANFWQVGFVQQRTDALSQTTSWVDGLLQSGLIQSGSCSLDLRRTYILGILYPGIRSSLVD
jgi:hypothetical protein